MTVILSTGPVVVGVDCRCIQIVEAGATSSVTPTGRSSDDDADYQTAYQSARTVAVNGGRGRPIASLRAGPPYRPTVDGMEGVRAPELGPNLVFGLVRDYLGAEGSVGAVVGVSRKSLRPCQGHTEPLAAPASPLGGRDIGGQVDGQRVAEEGRSVNRSDPARYMIRASVWRTLCSLTDVVRSQSDRLPQAHVATGRDAGQEGGDNQRPPELIATSRAGP
jgi:hypothetical protein